MPHRDVKETRKEEAGAWVSIVIARTCPGPHWDAYGAAPAGTVAVKVAAVKATSCTWPFRVQEAATVSGSPRLKDAFSDCCLLVGSALRRRSPTVVHGPPVFREVQKVGDRCSKGHACSCISWVMSPARL